MIERVSQGIAIPGLLLRFLERASLGYAGTRDARLVPAFHWVGGWRVEQDARRIDFFVSDPFVAPLLQNVQQCPRIALTVEHIGPHETYQFKGDFAGSRELDDADQAAFVACRDRCVRDIQEIERRFHFPNEVLQRYHGTPARTIVLAVDEIFLQTPGPGAGRRLVPPEAA